MKFPHVSHVVGVCVLLAACAGAKVEQISPGDLALDHAKVRIDAPDKAAFTIADARLRPRVVSLALPFQLAEVPKTAPITPQDMMATIFHVLGIPPDQHFHDQAGRPTPMIDGGRPIAELV